MNRVEAGTGSSDHASTSARSRTKANAGGRLQLALVAATALPALGCYSTWDIGLREVDKLNGYRAPGPPAIVVATDGDKVKVDEGTTLQFRPRTPSPDLFVRFEAIDVHGNPTAGDGRWWVSGVLRGDGRTIGIDLNQVAFLTARRFSPGMTTGLVVGVVVGVAAAVLIPLAVGMSNSKDD